MAGTLPGWPPPRTRAGSPRRRRRRCCRWTGRSRRSATGRLRSADAERHMVHPAVSGLNANPHRHLL